MLEIRTDQGEKKVRARWRNEDQLLYIYPELYKEKGKRFEREKQRSRVFAMLLPEASP